MSANNNPPTPSNFTVKKLCDKTDLSSFDCSYDDELRLNDFLHKEAFEYQQEDMGVTYLFYNNDDEIVGYVTVAMGFIRKKRTPLSVEGDDKIHFPALWLGRLAVHSSQRKSGVGAYLVKWCIGFAKKASVDVGCRFIVLVTKEGYRTKFYTKHGFQKCIVELDGNKKLLFFDLKNAKS